MNKNLFFGTTITILITSVIVVYVGMSLMAIPQTTNTPSDEFSFIVSSHSSCLRFLNSSVPVIYVPFTVASGQTAELTVNCTQMPGGDNGWTDVYIYRGFWDQGADHICNSGDIYPILGNVEPVDYAIKLNQPYVASFGKADLQSYTVFFLVPPGGPSTFQISFKPA